VEKPGAKASTETAGSNLVAQAAGRETMGSDAPNASTILTLSGDGVKKPLYLSLKDLKEARSGYIEQCYSVVNNYPTRKFVVGKGISLAYLLERAGIKQNAQSIQVEAADGYQAVLIRDQLMGQRYRYPGLMSGCAANAVEVKPMFAWAFTEGQNISNARADDLRLIIGHQGLHDVNTAVSVQKVAQIIVSTQDHGRWDKAAATLADGRITLSHDDMDQVKLYYTLNGTEPNINSNVYNPSTTYFQPDLIKPVPVSGSGTLKVKVVGYGKRDSEVLTYAY
jgi:hypothetical protein